MDYVYLLREALIWIITIFWFYQILVSVCSLVKLKDKPLKVNKNHRFMAIIPAHNEEMVVANLIESLKKINEVCGTSVDAEVAIIFDWENRWAIDDCQALNNENKGYNESCEEYYRVYWPN